jgi:hypothetical protein
VKRCAGVTVVCRPYPTRGEQRRHRQVLDDQQGGRQLQEVSVLVICFPWLDFRDSSDEIF